MFYSLSGFLAELWSVLNVLQYITFRSLGAAATGLFLSLALGPIVIRKFTLGNVGAVIRDDGPESHHAKAGTPTMGGLFVLAAVFVSVLLWGNLANSYVWTVLFIMLTFGFIGFLDDYLKLAEKSSRGLSSLRKYLLQSVFALAAALFLYFTASDPVETAYILPFFKDVTLELGIGFVVITYLMIVGTSNSVNLTDGLDGLAIMPCVMICGALGLIAYVVGHSEFADYLLLPHVLNSGELAVVCSAIVGAGLGFLWYNAYPATVIMGDVGSLALGAVLGIIAVMIRHEIVLLIMGGLFVLETFSVITQVTYFKLTGRRIFLMAPIHHHFELKGWKESHIIVRFWILTVMFVMVGLATLKLR